MGLCILSILGLPSALPSTWYLYSVRMEKVIAQLSRHGSSNNTANMYVYL